MISLKFDWPNLVPINKTATSSPVSLQLASIVVVEREGGGSVDSVNGQTGDVVLAANDVGADIAGSALAVTDALQPQITINTDAVAMLVALLSALQASKADLTYVNEQIANLVNSDAQTLATIQAITDALAESEDLLEALDQTVANRVRFDVATQGLTALQKYNARTNIGAEEVGTAAMLISQITAASIGAVTASQLATVATTGSYNDLTNKPNITGTLLTGLTTVAASAITATDSIIGALAKLQANIETKADAASTLLALSLKQDKLPTTGTAGQFLAHDMTFKTPAGGGSGGGGSINVIEYNPAEHLTIEAPAVTVGASTLWQNNKLSGDGVGLNTITYTDSGINEGTGEPYENVYGAEYVYIKIDRPVTGKIRFDFSQKTIKQGVAPYLSLYMLNPSTTMLQQAITENVILSPESEMALINFYEQSESGISPSYYSNSVLVNEAESISEDVTTGVDIHFESAKDFYDRSGGDYEGILNILPPDKRTAMETVSILSITHANAGLSSATTLFNMYCAGELTEMYFAINNYRSPADPIVPFSTAEKIGITMGATVQSLPPGIADGDYLHITAPVSLLGKSLLADDFLRLYAACSKGILIRN